MIAEGGTFRHDSRAHPENIITAPLVRRRVQAGTRGKASLIAFLFCLSMVALLMALPAVSAQPLNPEELIRDTTMRDGEPTTPSGDVISGIYEQMIWLSIAVFLIVSIILVYILVRFRHRKGIQREVPQIHGDSKLEIAWTIGPALVMIYLLVISYNGLIAIDEQWEEPEFTVQVEAFTFGWEFIYPDGETAGGRMATLRVEEDTWVHLEVTSRDVIHALAIPGLDVMIDANPGRINDVYFHAREPGVYLVQCRQFCGTGHGEMLAAVEVFEKGSQENPWGLPPRDPGVPGEPEQPDENVTLEPVDQELDVIAIDLFFDPAPIEAEPGQQVRITLTNDDNIPHNLFIGSYDRAATTGEVYCQEVEGAEECWASETLREGESTSFVLTLPEDPIAFDAWCDVPGHVNQGMITYFSVGGAEPEEDGFTPRLPGPGPALLVPLLVGLVVFMARRR